MDHDAEMRRKHARQELVREAVREIVELIDDASDGTEEMTNRLTRQMAMALIKAGESCYSGFLSMQENTDLTITALGRAQRIINKEPENSQEIKGWLWIHIVQEFIQKMAIPYSSAQLRWDVEHPAGEEVVAWPNGNPQ